MGEEEPMSGSGTGRKPQRSGEAGKVPMIQNDRQDRRQVLQHIPAVHEILEFPGVVRVLGEGKVPRWAVRRAIHAVLDRQRQEIGRGERSEVAGPVELEQAILVEAPRQARGNLRPLINATGVVLHTNLGRAPLAREALQAVQKVAGGYSNLELDLPGGKRGRRYAHVEDLLRELTGAEAALVVNNNAAAVFLALRALAHGREVVISRGELVEIGGSFRIPEILSESGAVLKEVGTTNRTHLRDYERAVSTATGLLLKVHPSNYHVVGFHKEVSLSEVVALGRRFSLPVMQDLGSGCLLDAGLLGVPGEPEVAEAVRTGADVVTFSGDKLLGGPQAGILVGRQEALRLIQDHPLLRALRVDKMTLSALEATLLLYQDLHLARERIPALAMLGADRSALARRAQRLANALRKVLPSSFRVAVGPSSGMAGGGSLPERTIPGYAVFLTSSKYPAHEIASRLRLGTMPVVVRIEKEEVLLDVRTILKQDLGLLISACREAFPNPAAV